MSAALKIPETAVGQKARPKTPEFEFERPDWTLFRSPSTLAQKAGVPTSRLRRLVLKELVDNALDAGANVAVGAIGEDVFFVEDDGPGIPGDDAEIADLFSIVRPLKSTKLWRMPARGALGNGLRVVMGSVAASGGRLTIYTNGRRLSLRPREDGGTDAVPLLSQPRPGTRIEIAFGASIPRDSDTLAWAEAAIRMAWGGESYNGRTSPHWYDIDAFSELLRAAGSRPVRDLVAQLDGCTGGKAGKIAAEYKGRTCSSMSRAEAADLLDSARREAREVRPERLGGVGPVAGLPDSYRRASGIADLGGAEVPFLVEAWAQALLVDREAACLQFFVNRTPITGEIRAWKGKTDISFYGCGLNHSCKCPRGSFRLVINLTTPFCPITSDGKSPDLLPFVEEIGDAIDRACSHARRALPRPSASSESLTQKAVILDRLDEAVAKASGDGQYRYNQRQLFYVLRPFIIEALSVEPTWPNFCQIITDYEAEHGELAGMFRDPRGTLYHPHLGQDIAIGTLAVERYRRPDWIFNKILYIEKEGFFEPLKAARWPERHDCALLTSKGFSSRAVRDLLDMFADDGEPISVFCIHDADASGTMIYETLQEETKARARRRVEIVNLGLEPWEALSLGLEVESMKRDGKRVAPVAGYVEQRPAGEHWADWLQANRVELNAFTTPAFIEWLDGKMADRSGKVVPPADVAGQELDRLLEERVRARVEEEILREAGAAQRVETELDRIIRPPGEELLACIEAGLVGQPDRRWLNQVERIAAELAEGARDGD